ncbi:hypothetical protein HO173_010939 [Letharia columbiana]|uniref:CCR4-NOT transcription complex subunit 4 n=1 Tax=Letharia columbiana TaxID=112416 RepID=A0A8H6FLP4_9LECA|nr:uncharacterized protein HO173_010939 [Letharia columbiana]KAF6230823.1 hypothetical protein HO173_010939 [Letharia columbiana]
MAGRVQQDAFIDDSDESCPLCVEEFDLSDKNFRPCPCGYQVCQFCYNNIKNHMNGLCPACRRPYDDQSIEWKIVSPEEQKADIALQARKKAMARKKETEQRQVETLNRKNLAGIRVVQKNLVYVVGLSQKSSEEEFLRTLRGSQYFGQYGKITKIVVSKAKEGQNNANNNNNSIGVYVTFENREDAAKCIAAVDGSQNSERTLRAQYGTTKYCSAFLRSETCGNRNCTFLHETGEDNDSFSRADLSSMNALSTQRPAQQASARPNQQPPQAQPPPQQAPQSISAASQAVARDEAMSRSDSGDGSALPSSASWAAKNAQNESTRSSKPASVAASSPVITNPSVPVQSAETRQVPSEPPPPDPISNNPPQTLTVRPAPLRPSYTLEPAMKTLVNSSFKFTFDRSIYSEDDLKEIDAYPPLFDDHGGLVRYRMAKEQELERQKQEEERNVIGAMSATEDEEAPASGSLQLGGEPETQDEPNDNSGRISAQQRSVIQPPFGSSSSFSFGGTNFPGSNAASLARTLTPQQQHQLSLLRSQSRNQQSPVNNGQYQPGYTGNTSLHHHQQSNPFQVQNQAFNTAQGHGRQASRYTFANDSASASTTVKPAANPQLMAQQAAMMPGNQNKHFQNQQLQSNVHGNHFYSGVQGPPPGLKSSGTPPISGGGMFGQGHGFASAMGGSAGFGGNIGGKNTNDDLMRELLRTRNGSINGQGSDIGKREFKLPFTQQPMISDAPASSLLSSLYGSQIGGHYGYQDHHLQKQKKKGKKHRHANTSSSGGGGIVDLADPSILQARMHHGAAGQGQFGAQGQGGYNPNSMLYGGGYGGRWQL